MHLTSDFAMSAVNPIGFFAFFVLFCGYSGLSYLCGFASLREIFLYQRLSQRLSAPV